MITVATPTYNRAHTLPRVYESLCNQTSKDFKWLVIDDGSTDSTEELVNGWIKEKRIPIEYLKKENGGKASALNLGIENLNTEYAVCLDSDDIFTGDAIENALKELQSISELENCCGILALRHHADGKVMGGNELPDEYKFVTCYDVLCKYRTEVICFYKTKILKNYRFPVFKNEKFVSPAWMQFEITQKYKYKASKTRYCECEYLGDGLTKNKKKVIVKNPRGYTCVKKYSFNLSTGFMERVRNGIMYDCGCLLSHDKDFLQGIKHKVLAVLLMPIAFVVKKIRFKV